MLYQVLIIVYVLIALALIGLVLIQQGKGADMGASFGAGSSATVFGSGGSGNFLTKSTTYLAVAFFAISLILGNITANKNKAVDEWNNLSVPTEQAIDAIPGESLEADAFPAAQNNDVPASDDTAGKEENSNVPD
ncbi:preprotein translocase subunit SecG [Colwellia sp. MT41]|uniref:Protein-export membrane protein SecG n=1 Tax=Colwellia marinimaniae TaxID=1513592 RepID=A0ABQ0MUD7_9GAMM|nr:MULTISPECIES: preprotein translocase subunit SecG [Colwellia]ALO35313.1 preprotein translocase subunit SecG [Colwellia sp. MT41]GAW95988.1 preprotein translocase subunit SecG [Colwellia marinimaniae]